MGVFHLNNLPKQKRIQMIGEFYDMIDSLKNRNEVRLFLRDLLAPDEIATLMRRIEIAVLLEANFSYRQIIEILGVGRAKITNVNKCLLKDDSGYKIIIKRLLENRKSRLKRIKKDGIESSFFERLKKKYPLHFLLPNLFDKVLKKIDDNGISEKEAILFTPSSSFLRNNRKDNRKTR